MRHITTSSAATDLRSAIDLLPVRTRESMLEGVAQETVITGAYADGDGGVCPMLAAHRQGARANFIVFAGAWDRFTGVDGRQICRRATQGELGVLVALLEQSLREEGPLSDLAAAIAEHQALARTRRGREASDVGLDWLHGGDDAPAPVPSRAERRELVLA